MYKIASTILLLSASLNSLLAQFNKSSIYFELNVQSTPLSKPLPDSMTIRYIEYNMKPWSKIIWDTKSKNEAKWNISTTGPIHLMVTSISIPNKYFEWLLEPGDSIVANYLDGKLRFSGNGADKLNLNNEIFSMREVLTKPSNSSVYTLKSLDDYKEWDAYLDKQWFLSESLIHSYKEKLSSFSVDYTKIMTISYLEKQRWHKFVRLPRETFNIDKKVLCDLYDKDFLTPQANWMRAQSATIIGEMIPDVFVAGLLNRQNNFSKNYKIEDSQIERALLVYKLGKKVYRGEALEYFLASYLTRNIIKEYGFVPKTEEILQQYYADKERNSEYKTYVKNYELNARIIKKRNRVPDFTLYDQSGNVYNKTGLKGKVILLHFQNADDKASEEMNASLSKIENTFKDDPYVVFLHIFANEDMLKRVVQNNYTSGKGINVFLRGDLKQDSILKKYNVNKYPALYLINQAGRLVTSSFVDSLSDVNFIAMLIRQESEIAKKEDWQGTTDGPYILQENDTIKAFTFLKGELNKQVVKDRENQTFAVATDEPGKTFSVTLKDVYKIEPSEFVQPVKMLTFSDIEGNFDALRLLLQRNGVIDDHYNWTFGKGHLVFAGDMFDRGEQVTECLWLLYSLEEKAKATGGYVHFILGNHELMNLEGNFKYTRNKYRGSAQKIGKPLVELYGNNTELGKWLRSKNIIEKIGNILFVHGGVSKDIISLGLTIQEINELARPYYGNSKGAIQSGNPKLALLYDTRLSPFWYRDYYLTSESMTKIGYNKRLVFYKTPKKIIDEILEHFHVNKIVTGHTIFEGVNEGDIGKWISIHYDGKVINTDTEHRLGYTEALLMEGEKYYKVNKEGERWELFNYTAQGREFAF